MLATWGCATFPKPTLDLQFAGATSLDSRITFTRATTATYFNSAGVLTTAASGEARFDYNPATLASLGLLIEEQRTNLLTYSEELDNAAWTANGVTVSANAGTAPSGAVTADKVIPTAVASTFKELQQNFSATSGTTYTFSVFAKSAGYRYVQLVATSVSMGTVAVNYDLDTGTETAYTAGTSTVVARSITSIGNGWYRLSVSLTAIGTSPFSRMSLNFIPAADSARGVSWTGDGTSGILAWGYQVETGAFPTSYIPTTTTALTRNKDVASISGSNFTSFYNSSEGVLFGDFINNLAAYTNFVAALDSDTSNYIGLARFTSATAGTSQIASGGVTQADLSLGVVATLTNYKIAVAYKSNDFANSINGGTPATDSLGTVPTVDKLSIGNLAGSINMNGTIRRIAYYPTRLPNSTLQALTA